MFFLCHVLDGYGLRMAYMSSHGRPVGGGEGGAGGTCAPPFWTEVYKTQYEYRCPQGSHQLNIRSLATH